MNSLETLPSWLSGEQVASLARAHGTPLYVYSTSSLRTQAQEALSLPAPFGLTVRYAMKANPHIEILKLFREEALHIDASSGYEAEKALESGYKPSQILITAQPAA